MTPRALKCPRCGYDQSGHVATWDESCPLSGRCVECGDEFEWASVFYPDRGDVRGFVEHARDGRRAFLWAYRTWLWTLLPWVFWSRIQVDQRSRLPLLMLWLPMLLLPGHIVASLLGVGIWRVRAAMILPGGGGRLQGVDYISYFTFPVLSVRGGTANLMTGLWPSYIIPAAVFFLAWPALLMLLPATRGRAKLRWEHVLRGVVFGMAWLLPLVLFRIGRNAMAIIDLLERNAQVRTLPPNAVGVAVGIRTVRLGEWAPDFWGPALFIWIGVWWLAASVRGWRIADGYIVWVFLTMASALCAAIAFHADFLTELYFGL